MRTFRIKIVDKSHELTIIDFLGLFFSWTSRASGSTTTEINNNAKALMREYYAFMLLAVSPNNDRK